MKNELLKKIMIFCLIGVLITGCNATDKLVKSDTESSYSFESFDEIVNMSSNIVLAKVVSRDMYKGTNRYHLNIEKDIKGMTSETIYLLFDNDDLEIGSRWVFFLNYYQHPQEKDLTYIAVSEFNALVSQDNQIEEFYLFETDLTEAFNSINDIEEFIHTVDDGTMTDKPVADLGAISPTSIDELIALSDVIVEVKIKSITGQGDFGSTVLCNYNKIYKGKVSDKNSVICVQPGVEIGDEYLLFLSITEEGTYIVNSRIGFVDKLDEKEYDKYLKEILK